MTKLQAWARGPSSGEAIAAGLAHRRLRLKRQLAKTTSKARALKLWRKLEPRRTDKGPAEVAARRAAGICEGHWWSDSAPGINGGVVRKCVYCGKHRRVA